MYCSPFAIFLCIVYRGLLNDFATWWLFYVWFLSNDLYHVQTYDLWFLSVRTICRTILWSNIQLTMFILSQYYTHALSNVAITFIEWFIPYCFASSWRYQVVQILTLFDIRFSLWQRYIYNVFWNKRSETYVLCMWMWLWGLDGLCIIYIWQQQNVKV